MNYINVLHTTTQSFSIFFLNFFFLCLQANKKLNIALLSNDYPCHRKLREKQNNQPPFLYYYVYSLLYPVLLVNVYKDTNLCKVLFYTFPCHKSAPQLI